MSPARVPAPEGRPGHLICRLKQIATALFLEETAELRLTPVQYATLAAIGETSGLSQLALARRIAFDPTTVVKVLDRLLLLSRLVAQNTAA